MRLPTEAVRAIAAACLVCLLACAKNTAPDAPGVFGPAHVGDHVELRAFASDPEGNNIAYLFEWGDPTAAGWSLYHPSGETVLFTHVYEGSGVYYVKAKARDAKGLESGWSDSLAVYVGPPPFWEPDAEDTAAIDACIRANKQFFASAFNELGLLAMDTVLPGTTAVRLRNEVRGNRFKQRFRCDQMQHLFFTDSFDLEYTFIAGLDSTWAETTCAVTLTETIPGKLRLHAYSYTRYLFDSLIFVPPNETLRLPVYDTLFTDTSMIVEKELAGASIDGCVLRQTGGQWELWKTAGGGRFYAPGPDDAPYIMWVCLASGSREDTVWLRPDTLHYGIQRFFPLDALLTYAVGDSLRVSGFLTNVTDAATYVYLDHVRHETEFGWVPLTPPGRRRLFVEVMPIEVLWEMTGDYNATVWGIPIDVKP